VVAGKEHGRLEHLPAQEGTSLRQPAASWDACRAAALRGALEFYVR